MHPLLKALNLPKKTRIKRAHAIKHEVNNLDERAPFFAWFGCHRCSWKSETEYAFRTTIRTGIACPICNKPKP